MGNCRRQINGARIFGGRHGFIGQGFARLFESVPTGFGADDFQFRYHLAQDAHRRRNYFVADAVALNDT